MSSLQLHLFKCTKEEEVKNTLKKHIYFVSSNNVFIVYRIFNRFPFECSHNFSLITRGNFG